MVKPFKKSAVHESIEEFHFIRATLKNSFDDVFNHRLCGIHVAVEVAESHFGLYLPELRGMTCGVAVFCTECGSERVNIAERKCKCLAMKLTADGKVAGFSEKVF